MLPGSAPKSTLAIVRDVPTGRYMSYTLNSVGNPSGVRDYGASMANDAAFAQLEFSPTEKIRVVAGSRYDSIRYDFKNNLTPGSNYGAANEVRSFARFSPKLGATYAVDASNSLYGNIGFRKALGIFKRGDFTPAYPGCRFIPIEMSPFIIREQRPVFLCFFKG